MNYTWAKLRKWLVHPELFAKLFVSKTYYLYYPDRFYLKMLSRLYLGYRLNLIKPQTFNEKLQWLKLYDRNPLYTKMVDKYAAKQYVADCIGEQYIVPTLGVWDTFEEIDFDKLPDQFVLKTTHDSGGIVICKHKATFNIAAARKKLNKSLKRNFYYVWREWPYKNVKPRIIAETYMVDKNKNTLEDYKLMCFNGKVKCTFVATGRFTDTGLRITFFDKDWHVLPFEKHYPRTDHTIERPETYDQMVELAETLSKNIPFVRVDFYQINGRIYFGELTFYPGAGLEEITPIKWDYTLGDWLRLPGEN